MYVYKPLGNYYSVGFYTPDGEWIEESLCETREEAAGRVHYLNGGN